MQFWSSLPLPAGPNQMPPFMLTRLIFPLSVMACPFVFFRFCVYWAVFPKLEPTRNNSSLGLPSGVTRCTTCLSSICIRGSVITKIGTPSASQITRLCSKLKNLPWHWNTTSGDESERTSTGIDEPEHPDAYWCILSANCSLRLFITLSHMALPSVTKKRSTAPRGPPPCSRCWNQGFCRCRHWMRRLGPSGAASCSWALEPHTSNWKPSAAQYPCSPPAQS